jgi:hypothetical protein
VQKMMICVCILMLCLALTGCPKSSIDSNQEEGAKEIQSGDYYSFISIEGDYKVLKVLVVEGDVVHFCYYNNVFKEPPSESIISSLFFGKKQLDMFIGFNQGQQTTGRKHIALEIKGWDDLKPQFIVNSEVTSGELDAYEEWKVGDRYILPSGTTISN